MIHGIKVAGGDRLGKTIIFAKNHDHADFIVERFERNYPHLKGQFARLIDYSITCAQTLIDDFSEAEKAPHIAVSVDMLDTGMSPRSSTWPFQDRSLAHEVLADGRAWHPPPTRFVCPWRRQARVLDLCFLPEPGILR